MSSDIIFWIGAVAYLAIGIFCAVTYASDRYTEKDEARETIRSLQRSRTVSGRKFAGGVLVLVVLLWPVWFPIYWFGGSEENETDEAIEEFRRNHPETRLPADSKQEAGQPPEPTR